MSNGTFSEVAGDSDGGRGPSKPRHPSADDQMFLVHHDFGPHSPVPLSKRPLGLLGGGSRCTSWVLLDLHGAAFGCFGQPRSLVLLPRRGCWFTGTAVRFLAHRGSLGVGLGHSDGLIVGGGHFYGVEAIGRRTRHIPVRVSIRQ